MPLRPPPDEDKLRDIRAVTDAALSHLSADHLLTTRRQVTTLALAPGAVMCLFTDGLVERRDELIDDGITRLCQTVTPGPPEGVCVSIMQALIGRQYPGDDIALLVLRWQHEEAAFP